MRGGGTVGVGIEGKPEEREWDQEGNGGPTSEEGREGGNSGRRLKSRQDENRRQKR